MRMKKRANMRRNPAKWSDITARSSKRNKSPVVVRANNPADDETGDLRGHLPVYMAVIRAQMQIVGEG